MQCSGGFLVLVVVGLGVAVLWPSKHASLVRFSA